MAGRGLPSVIIINPAAVAAAAGVTLKCVLSPVIYCCLFTRSASWIFQINNNVYLGVCGGRGRRKWVRGRETEPATQQSGQSTLVM